MRERDSSVLGKDVAKWVASSACGGEDAPKSVGERGVDESAGPPR
jgi:hypothetical protein